MSAMAPETRCSTATTIRCRRGAATLLEILFRRMLLFDRGGGGELPDPTTADGTNGALRPPQLGGDVVGRLGSLHGQRLDFGRDDSKTFTGRARRLDRGIESKQIRSVQPRFE